MPAKKTPIVHVPLRKPLNWQPGNLDLSRVFVEDEKDKKLAQYRGQLKAIESAQFRLVRAIEAAPKTERSETARELLEALIEIESDSTKLDRFLDGLMQLN
ncbi:hypothetical protein H6F88_17940 [Oculatella sp. FACHB-28]|uniref:hypothetical protein n=1 Tax=Oculatella sp. FACHB-28 TaxID=2692845 RepID=UPI0016854586|nr:hypothetical protein [Oculatella sp. FACHB-28]MBD2057878.1 hypothetical protein [Oculatella sp. FACHB-28]